MNLKIGFLIIVFLFVSKSHAQDFIIPDASCGLTDTLFQLPGVLSFASDREANEVMNKIIEVVGLHANFIVQAAEVPNAAAAIIGYQRYILYNPSFIRQIRLATRNDWPAISILAHELGHHLNGHTLKVSGSRPGMELEADEFSGFVLRKMGATLEESQEALRLVASPYGSLTHPPASERLEAVEAGWNRADAYLQGKFEAQVSYAPQDARYQVSFDTNPDRIYFLTDDYSFITVQNGSRVKMGVMYPHSSASYPFVIRFSGFENQGLYMSRSGELVNQQGKVIGRASFLSK